MMTPLDQERLDILAGVRTEAVKKKAAVRREDLAALVSLAKQIASPIASGSTVTAAEYNAVVSDLSALWQAVAEIAARIK